MILSLVMHLLLWTTSQLQLPHQLAAVSSCQATNAVYLQAVGTPTSSRWESQFQTHLKPISKLQVQAQQQDPTGLSWFALITVATAARCSKTPAASQSPADKQATLLHCALLQSQHDHNHGQCIQQPSSSYYPFKP
ncbi:hypothetical protein COO60DRAFT_1113878 [Scenedesmus sp. NREL 46B-D3]|nr:hypothetical protein COO60DRAFT_1113878 [Scenedesmus sp. NREL 46B-D3]